MAIDADHVDQLAGEYAEAAARVNRAERVLRRETHARNAVVRAFDETGLTQKQIADVLGLTAARVRTMAHNHWLAEREVPDVV